MQDKGDSGHLQQSKLLMKITVVVAGTSGIFVANV